jgi:alkyl hydroperoxide reductase subunit F
VAVIGGGNSALDAAIQLERIARSVYLIDIAPQLSGDAIMQDKLKSSGKVLIMHNCRVAEIFGDKSVKGIRVKEGLGEKAIELDGVFVEIGLTPNSYFAKELVKNQKQEIIINCNCETNIPGIFAAGDVTDVSDKQIIIAAGDGAKAVLSAFRYIIRNKP